MSHEILLTFKTPSVSKLQYTESRNMFFKENKKTVGSGITDYKTKCYLTKIIKSFVGPLFLT